MCVLWLILCFGWCTYRFSVKRLSDVPLISNNVTGESDFRYNYNSAYFPLPDGNTWALAVRGQDMKPGSRSYYDVGPSYIVYCEQSSENPLKFESVRRENTMIFPKKYDIIDQSYGVEDPRITYDPVGKKYYMFYTAITYDIFKQRISKLALAVCDASVLPVNFVTCWELKGHVFTGLLDIYDKSGALLIRPNNQTTSYLLYGSKHISVATSEDLKKFHKTDYELVKVRKDHFDSHLVESGPNPIQLSDGNFLFLYNSARLINIPNPKNYPRQYNLGYIIFNFTTTITTNQKKEKEKKINIIQRMEKDRLLWPVLDWERCDDKTKGSYYYTGLTPNVVFVDGWRKKESSSVKDVFEVVYQGCDSFTSLVEIEVYF